MSDIRFNQWLHQSGTGGVSQDHIGNIGIGTTNPSIVVSAANTAVLNVGVITANNLFVNNAFNGDITGNVTGNISGATGTFSGNVDIADKIIHTGDTDTAMRFPADNTFAVDTAGSERLRITSDGQIGMGIALPTQESGTGLHIRGANGGQTRIHLTNSDTGDTATDGFYIISQGAESGGASGEVMLQQKENKALKFATNNTERLRITSAGKLTVTPADTTSSYATTDGGIDIAQTISSTGTSSSQSIGIQFSLTKSGQTGAIAEIGAIREGSGLSGLVFRTRDNSTGRNERLRISSDGNVGINETNPIGDLSITGANGSTMEFQPDIVSGTNRITNFNRSTSTYKAFRLDASQHEFLISGTERMRINADGYVTKSNQPRFFATRSSHYTSYDGRNTGNTWIAFDVLDYNVGGGFQTSGSDQGLFVAPVSGLYLFHASVYKGTGNTDWSQSWFNINSQRANGTDWVVDSSRFAQNAIQVYMTAGQKIGFHPYNNQTNNEIRSTANHTWFKGCLLG